MFAQIPVANFSNDKSVGCNFLIVQFSDHSINNPLIWAWRIYRNNSLDTLKSSVQNPLFAFYDEGKYDVSLTVKNSYGSNTLIKKSLIVVKKLPSNSFIADRSSICESETISFKYISSVTDTVIRSWYWDFGDGNFSSLANPTHIYLNAGYYKVSLLVKDILSCENEKNNYAINVISSPKVDFVSFVTQFCLPPATITLLNKTSGTNLQYQWYINKIKSSTQINPILKLNNSGTFDISLKAVNNNGCSDSITKKGFIQINTYLDTISSNIRSGCSPLTVNFKDLTTSGAKTWKWYFGDGDSASVQNPVHVFKNPGYYTITLVTTNSLGCKSISTNKNFIQVFYKPTISFLVNDSINCNIPFQVNFMNLTPNTKSLEWNFGDGVKNKNPNTSHVYTALNTYTVSLNVTDNNGCSNTLIKNNFIKVFKPSVRFNKSTDGGCAPVSVTFTDSSLSSSSVSQRLWYFGDGTTSTQVAPTHIYKDTGTYNVSLVISDSKGCKDSLTMNKFIGIGNPPVIDFKSTDTAGCIPLNSSFTNNTKFANIFSWSFGDGSSDFLYSPKHIYQTFTDPTGFLDVKLKASQYGCENTLIKYKYIHILPPIPKINIPINNSCDIPFTTMLINQSQYDDLAIWYFDDGTPADTVKSDTVQHTFYERRAYTIQLKVYNNKSKCMNTQTQPITISNITPDFYQKLQSNCKSSIILFTDSSSVNTGITKRSWDFGDGILLDSTLKEVTHQYNNLNNYNVKLTITDQLKCSQSVVKKVVNVNQSLTPKFDADKMEGCTPLLVSFSDLSTAISPSKISKWLWDFGDGKTDITQNPQHIYKIPGKYTVSLKITDSYGCDTILTKTSLIKPTNPVVSFSLNNLFNKSDTLTCFSDSAHFKNTSVGVGLKFVWDFNDGNTSNLLNPVHLFKVDSTKNFNVSLTVTDQNGCITSLSKKITVAQPIARFDGDPRKVDCPYPIRYFKFTDASTTDVVKWSWTFGDKSSGSNNFSNINNPQHSYRNAGYFDVSLAVRDKFGCYDSIFKPKYIFVDGPDGTFEYSVNKGCPPLEVDFQATTINTVNYYWIFGDGNYIKSNDDSAKHTYYLKSKVIQPILILESPSSNGTICQVPVLPELVNGQLNDSIILYDIPKANAGQDIVVCSGYNTLISASGGLTYSWNNGKTTDIIVENPVNSVNYIVTVFGQYCSKADTMSVFVIPLPIIKGCKDTSVCKGMRIKLSVSGGIKYNWNNKLSATDTLELYPVQKDTYTVTVTDINGCSAQDSVTVSIRDSLQPVFVGKKEVCIGDSTILIVINKVKSYRWNTGALSSSIQIPPLTINKTYTVTITDNSGCSGISSTMIQVNPLPYAEAGAEQINCIGFKTALSATGGIKYSWTTGETKQIISVSPIEDQYFTVTVTDQKGCSSIDSVSVLAKPNPFIKKMTDTTICAGTKIELKAISDYNNIYKWSKGDITPMIEVNPIKNTDYTVTVYNIWNCWTSSQVTVYTIALPETPSVDSELVCFTADKIPATVLLEIKSPEQTNSYNWFSNKTSGDIIQTGTSLLVHNVLASLTFYVEAVSSKGCKSPLGTASIIAGNKPVAQYTFDSILPLTEFAETNFYDYSESRNGNENMKYRWIFGNNEYIAYNKYPVYTFMDSGNYHVTLIVTNSDNCSDTLSKLLHVYKMLLPWVPDAFTPNNDSYNNKLYVRGSIKRLIFEVYNEAGFKVFKSNSQSDGWDGTYKGVDQPIGNYVWKLNAVMYNNKEISMYGMVVLIR